MGTSQSTQRAAKFSGNNRRSMRATGSAPYTGALRRTASTNTNRAVKEFSKFWTQGGSFQPHNKPNGRRSRPGSTRRAGTTSGGFSRSQSIEPRHPGGPSLILTPTSTPASVSPLPPRRDPTRHSAQSRPTVGQPSRPYVAPGAPLSGRSASRSPRRPPSRTASFKQPGAASPVPTHRSRDLETII
ncbi:unnamed protein product, partial [Mesorhabditis spiculigera]